MLMHTLLYSTRKEERKIKKKERKKKIFALTCPSFTFFLTGVLCSLLETLPKMN